MAASDNLTLYRYECTNKGYVEDLGDGVMLTLMLIPAGEFMMGAPDTEPDSEESERPQHRVNVPQFLMGHTPVTQAQWRVVVGYEREDIDLEANPSRFKGDNLPVERVSWEEASEFCKRLATKTLRNYHLPSEAQWEYACRAETTTAYHYGDKMTSELANYQTKRTMDVGGYPPNRWGLYDMHSSVYEWCQDNWHGTYEGAPSNGSAWIADEEDEYKVIRGGYRGNFPRYCRSAYRGSYQPSFRSSNIGFRVCCSASRAQEREVRR